jgi:hypothetical protein
MIPSLRIHLFPDLKKAYSPWTNYHPRPHPKRRGWAKERMCPKGEVVFLRSGTRWIPKEKMGPRKRKAQEKDVSSGWTVTKEKMLPQGQDGHMGLVKYWKQLENKQEMKCSRFMKWNNCIN